jgi:hypothetical protein
VKNLALFCVGFTSPPRRVSEAARLKTMRATLYA